MILIIGGAGYIGSHFAKFSKRPHVVFDNLSTGHREFAKYGDFFQGDIRNITDLESVFQKYSIDTVAHFGAAIEVGESVVNPSKYYQNNLVGTLNLLDTMIKYNVKKLIYSSTCATYGLPTEAITEDTPQNPINPYGRSKRMTEEIIKDYHHAYGLNYVIFRYFNACGNDFECEVGEDHQPESHLIPNVIKSLKGEKVLHIFGNDYPTPDGTCIRDYIHVIDLADAHIKAIDYLHNTNSSLICNLGTGKGNTVMEIIKKVEEMSSQKVDYVMKGRRDGDAVKLVADYTRAKEVLGWEPVYNLDDIVRSVLMWFGILNKE